MTETDEQPERERSGPIDWEPVRTDVETTTDSLVAIAKRHGLKHGTLTQQVCRKGWLRPGQTAKAKAARDEEPVEAWLAKLRKSFDGTDALDRAIQRQIRKETDSERLLSLHERRLAAVDRSVRVAAQLQRLIESSRAAAQSEDDGEWDSVTELERQLFARAGIT